MRFAPAVVLLLIAGCTFPYGGGASVQSFPPGVKVDANAPPPPPEPPHPEDAVEDRAELVDEMLNSITACLRYPSQAMRCKCLRENGHTDEVYREAGCPVQTPPPHPSELSPVVQPDVAGAANLQADLDDAMEDVENTNRVLAEQLESNDKLRERLKRIEDGCTHDKTLAGHTMELIAGEQRWSVFCNEDATNAVTGDG